MNYPPITAVMVTSGRLHLVQKSYQDFQNQTYPNKNLLIVTDTLTHEHESLKKFTKDKNVTVLHVGQKKILGELRNISIEYASSDLSIQWDDDDRYGPTRIMEQWQGLDNQAVMLTEQLHYFADTGEVAWVKDDDGIEGTLLLDRRCGLVYPAQGKSEDTVLKKELQKRNLLSLVTGGSCYCRIYHGSNTWDREHHIERARLLGKKIDKKDLEKAAKLYNWKKNWKLI